MNLTISSNSMLKPLFITDRECDKELPPERIVGLLTLSTSISNNVYALDKVVEYHRPEREHAMLTSARWTDFLQIDGEQQIQRMAVFGFFYDGEREWYQLWNATKLHVCWVRHSDKLNYKPFAILAMDALVTLMPHWQGWLFQHPTKRKPDNPFLPITADQIDQHQIQRIMVSDASTNRSGDLWFLVTINSTAMARQHAMSLSSATIPNQHSRSGWITHMLQ